MPRTRLRRQSGTSRLWSAAGQTTVEWLMIAGTLTATVVFFSQASSEALRTFVKSLAAGVRTIAP